MVWANTVEIHTLQGASSPWHKHSPGDPSKNTANLCQVETQSPHVRERKAEQAGQEEDLCQETSTLSTPTPRASAEVIPPASWWPGEARQHSKSRQHKKTAKTQRQMENRQTSVRTNPELFTKSK